MIAKITFTKPTNATVEDVATYIHDALSSWGGGLRPEDPMFHSLRDMMTIIEVNGKKYDATEKRR